MVWCVDGDMIWYDALTYYIVIRVYTILPPVFYNALKDFNENQRRELMPLNFFQGVWSPENELMKLRNLLKNLDAMERG